MSLWHILLYVGASLMALRSFVRLTQSYRSEYEQQLITKELEHMKQLKQSSADADKTSEEHATPS